MGCAMHLDRGSRIDHHCRQCDYSEGSHTSDRDSSVQTRPQSFRRVRRLRLGPLWRRRLGSRTAGGWAVCCCSSWWWCWPWWCWCWSREGDLPATGLANGGLLLAVVLLAGGLLTRRAARRVPTLAD